MGKVPREHIIGYTVKELSARWGTTMSSDERIFTGEANLNQKMMNLLLEYWKVSKKRRVTEGAAHPNSWWFGSHNIHINQQIKANFFRKRSEYWREDTLAGDRKKKLILWTKTL